MTPELAYKKFREFVKTELRGKGERIGWMKIDGSRICETCRNNERTRHRTALYIYCHEGHSVYLKCFKASCNLSRRCTYEDFIALGFTDKEVIDVLLDYSNKEVKTTIHTNTSPLVITDTSMTAEQKAYFKSRTGIDITPVTIDTYRIAPNIEQVVRDSFTSSETQAVYNGCKIRYPKTGICFYTNDYNTFSYRSINGSFKLVFSADSSIKSKGYVLQRGTSVKNIVVAEGVFDIINIYNYVVTLDDTLYIATFGFEKTLSCIEYWYRQHIESVERLIICADSDISTLNGSFTIDEPIYNKLIKRIYFALGSDAFEHVVIAYNTKSKDFGDLKHRIVPDKIEIR